MLLHRPADEIGDSRNKSRHARHVHLVGVAEFGQGLSFLGARQLRGHESQNREHSERPQTPPVSPPATRIGLTPDSPAQYDKGEPFSTTGLLNPSQSAERMVSAQPAWQLPYRIGGLPGWRVATASTKRLSA